MQVQSDADGVIDCYSWQEGVGIIAKICNNAGFIEIGRGEHAKRYYNAHAAFDIETTKLTNENWTIKRPEMEHYFNVTYAWSVYINDYFIFGRSIDDFFSMLEAVRTFCNQAILLWHVHNLAFEFNNNVDYFFHCKWIEGFWRNGTTPLFVRLENHEFRCTAQLTHKSLRQIGNEIKIAKLDDYDYDRKIGIYDAMTGNDIDYCMRDVKIVWYYIEKEMKSYCGRLKQSVNAARLPLTQTGYVRNDIKKNFSRTNEGRLLLKNTALSHKEYLFIRPAFYGGDVHTNFRTVGKEMLLKDGERLLHVDLKSAYPWAICTKKFCLKYSHVDFMVDDILLREWLQNPDTGIIADVTLENVVLKPRNIPYIPVDENAVKSAQLDTTSENGKLVSAAAIRITLCDTDLRLVLDTYDVENIIVHECYTGYKRPLPYSIVSTVVDYFNRKTTLKNVKTGDPDKDAYIEYLYQLSKQMLNGIYGLFATALENCEFTLDPNTFEIKPGPAEYKEASVLPYQIALQITAYVREAIAGFCIFLSKNRELQFWYCDTDSIFCRDNWRVREYVSMWNEERRAEAERLQLLYWDIIPTAPDGTEQVLGSFDIEDDPEKETDPGKIPVSFCSIGAKRYYIGYADGTYQITFSGLRGTKRRFNKKTGRWENGRNTQRLLDQYGSMHKAFLQIKEDSLYLPFEEGTDKLGHYNVRCNFVSHELGYEVRRPCSYTLYGQDLHLGLNKSLKWFLESRDYMDIMEAEEDIA